MTNYNYALYYKRKYFYYTLVLFLPMILFGWLINLINGYSWSDYVHDCDSYEWKGEHHMIEWKKNNH